MHETFFDMSEKARTRLALFSFRRSIKYAERYLKEKDERILDNIKTEANGLYVAFGSPIEYVQNFFEEHNTRDHQDYSSFSASMSNLGKFYEQMKSKNFSNISEEDLSGLRADFSNAFTCINGIRTEEDERRYCPC